LIVSLTSANSAKRQELLPIEKSYPLPELLEAVRYANARGAVLVM
jgi:adenine C2-methylase RlmN of 23S rRNA A2503 and tRNA A37